MPLTASQQVVTVHVSNGTYLQAVEHLMRYVEQLPECRIRHFDIVTPEAAPVIEKTASAIVALLEFDGVNRGRAPAHKHITWPG